MSTNIYEIRKPFIAEHNRLRSKLSTINNAEHGPGITAAWLRYFLHNPSHALYVSEAQTPRFHRVWYNSDSDDDDEDGDNEQVDLNVDAINSVLRKHFDSALALFEQAVQDCAWVPNDMKSKCVAQIHEGDEEPRMALLLTRCTYLKHLTILSPLSAEPNYTASNTLSWVIEEIVKAPAPGCFPMLKELLISSESDQDYPWNFHQSLLLGILPSLEAMHSKGVEVLSDDHLHVCDIPPLGSNLQRVTWEECELTDKWFFQALGGPKNLRVFELANSELGRFGHCDVFYVRATLLIYARHSLEELAIIPALRAHGCLSDIPGFAFLRKSVTHCTLLLEERREKEDSLFGSALQDRLPSSIEHLVLIHNKIPITLDVPPFISALLEVKEERFPNLQRFDLEIAQGTFEDPSPPPRNVSAGCKRTMQDVPAPKGKRSVRHWRKDLMIDMPSWTAKDQATLNKRVGAAVKRLETEANGNANAKRVQLNITINKK